MRVLLTNDDGIEAEGLLALRAALAEVPGVELLTIAPDGNRSAIGRSITTRRPLGRRRSRLRTEAPALRRMAHQWTVCASGSSGLSKASSPTWWSLESITARTWGTTSPTRARSRPPSRASFLV